MNPHYYLMKSKKILRLEEEESFTALPSTIQEQLLDQDNFVGLDQNQANWRVVIFRDEIMDLDEYKQWMNSPEALLEMDELELIAN